MAAVDEVKPAREAGRDARFVLKVLPWRVFIGALIWVLLTDGELSSLTVGVPVVLIAALASAMLMPRLPWRPFAMLSFAVYFLVQSLRGAVDVARRAFHPSVPLAPGVIEHRFRITGELPRVALANTISLLPGTLGADIGESSLYVHALDISRPELRGEIEDAEERIARLFSLELSSDVGS